MSEQRFIDAVRIAANIAMAVVVVLVLGNLAFVWGEHTAWYYPCVFSLQVFFILVQLWVIRMRRSVL